MSFKGQPGMQEGKGEEEDSEGINISSLTEINKTQQKNDNIDELETFRRDWEREIKAAEHKATPSAKSAAISNKNKATTEKLACINQEDDTRVSKIPEEESCDNQQKSEGFTNKKTDGKIKTIYKTELYASEEEREKKALQFYMHGVELERSGRLYAAIQQYRKAIHLEPCIESKATAVHASNAVAETEEEIADIDNVEEDDNNILFSEIAYLLSPSAPVCLPNSPQQASHFSCLPREILEKIMCWIVGAELDTRSLMALSATCRGFYVMTRNETIWRRACYRVWGKNCNLNEYLVDNSSKGGSEMFTTIGTVDCHYEQPLRCANSWRHMFLNRPRPRYNGCYISKTSYFRSGECNFIDHQTYQPWHLVVYYRYIRFFPDGCVLMTTVAEPPKAVVGQLAARNSRNGQVLVGKYTLDSSIVNMQFVRNRQKKSYNGKSFLKRRVAPTNEAYENILEMCMELTAARNGKRNWFLQWKEYNVTSVPTFGEALVVNMDVSQVEKFPQLAFSRVRSYNAVSTEPL